MHSSCMYFSSFGKYTVTAKRASSMTAMVIRMGITQMIRV